MTSAEFSRVAARLKMLNQRVAVMALALADLEEEIGRMVTDCADLADVAHQDALREAAASVDDDSVAAQAIILFRRQQSTKRTCPLCASGSRIGHIHEE